MPATDSEVTSMEDTHALEDREEGSTNIPSSVLPTSVPSLTPHPPTTKRPNFIHGAEIETKVVSMASNDCSSARSSPAEASPAKAAVTSPTTCNGPAEPSPAAPSSAASHIASASDSLPCSEMSCDSISESPAPSPVFPPTTFGTPDLKTDFPAALTFRGVSVTLENNGVWKQFNSCGTEMILTKQGRRMFPYCRYRLLGLEPTRLYSLVLSIVPSDSYRYRWNTSKWEISGPAEHQAQGLIRAFSHHYSPCRGSDWMGSLVSFYKLKLTNNSHDQDGHIIVQSMHRYIPRLHVIPVLEGEVPTSEKPVVMGPESMTFTFPQTEFMAVTTYQNFCITQLKINHNPFAKGFREDGNNSRLNRLIAAAQPDTQPSDSKPAELPGVKEEAVDLSIKNHVVSANFTNQPETRLVLKPIMSANGNKNEPFVPCIRGNHALGELVVVEDCPRVEVKEETHDVSVTPEAQQDFRVPPTATSMTLTRTASSPGSSPRYRKKRKRISKRWTNARGREWKAVAASPTVVHSPSLTVAMQPELDDVDGLLFVSFCSKEALEVHVRETQANNLPSASPVSPTTQTQLEQTTELIPETDEEKMVRFEAILLQDLSVFKHRQVIHPVLQEVGMKLSSLDPTVSIDLQYLGVHLPLPPPKLPEQGNTTSPSDETLPFVSRTGKTSDITKIKGWKNKFIRTKETSPSNCDGSQKNLSAFCSNMLDEYLESEAQNISERAAAFSTNVEGSVVYQLPAKSSSYVKTLDSVLKQRTDTSKLPLASCRPCPLSQKTLLTSAQTSPATQTGAQPIPAPSRMQPSHGFTASAASSSVQQRLSTHQPWVGQRAVASFGQSQGMTHKPSGLTKFQFKLLQMETGTLNDGLTRAHLTPDRLNVALSVMLTKEMLLSQILKVPQFPTDKANGPECGQDFCRLGCVCSSLCNPNRGSVHCRRPECMFGCTCFKRRIANQLTAVASEQQIHPVYSVNNPKYPVQPRSGSQANKLWNRNIDGVDPDPVFIPKGAAQCFVPLKAVKRSGTLYPAEPIREEDKDPVYKYLESMMTCARVRQFKSKPPQVTIEPKILDASIPNVPARPEKTTTINLPKMCNTALQKETSKGDMLNETAARKQIEIQSACQWKKDSSKILGALFQRMKRNRLSRRFSIGPYHIHPIAKIFLRKPSGSLIKYRVHISKRSEASDNDEEESDNSHEDGQADESFDNDMDVKEEDGQSEEPVMRYGVTPFLSGVLPAGKLRARTKSVGSQMHGLIQVNGKSYNQARLLLGNMGSLHPANRLAAYVTGRLRGPADIPQKASQISDPTIKINIPGTLLIKASGTVVPPTITARKTTELKTKAQLPVQLPQAESGGKGSMTVPQSSETVTPIQTFVLGQRNPVGSFQNSSTSSTVSLTVSPSLKTPSFLGQSGTFSFRICPPVNQGASGQNPAGIILPGGFTLIQLPKEGANGAGQESESPKEALLNLGHVAGNSDAKKIGSLTIKQVKELLRGRTVETGAPSEHACDDKMPSNEGDEANTLQADSNLDIASEDLSSDFSDDCGEVDEDEEILDIENVDEETQAVDKFREAVRNSLQESRDSSDGLGSAPEAASIQRQMKDEHDPITKMRRRNHTRIERQRRSEQRNLFDRLQFVLQSDPKTPRLHLLSQAVREIKTLGETCKYLEEQKKKLIHVQSVYIEKLSRLSGKSDTEIKQKLKDFYDSQKMKWSPFFSRLLQSRAALLQAKNPQSKLEVKPLLQPDFLTAPSQDSPSSIASQNSVDQPALPKPFPVPVAASSPAQVEASAPPPQTQDKPDEPGASAEVNESSSQSKVPSTTPAPTAQEGSWSKQNLNSPPTKQITLPLIRTKTGRIILPSSLKPIGRGFYKLTVTSGQQQGEHSKVNIQLADLPTDSRHAPEENRTVQSPDSEPKPPAVKSPLAAIALLNRSIPLPKAPKAAEDSEEGRNKTLSLSLTGSDLVHRGRGRPRKQPIPPVKENENPPAVEDSSNSPGESDTSPLVEDSEKIPLDVATDTVRDNPAPVKRRGRPPKRKLVHLRKSSDGEAGSSPSKEDIPFCLPRGFKIPRQNLRTAGSRGDMNSSRPLTRGSLGKDFPSAKKRSWIDVEKELEPEFEDE